MLNHSFIPGINPTWSWCPVLCVCVCVFLICCWILYFVGDFCIDVYKGYWSIVFLYLFWLKAMAPHSSTLAWKIPWTDKPGRLQSMGSLRVGHDWATYLSLLTFIHWRRKWQPTPVFLPGESQGWGSLVGFCLWGRRESDMTEWLSFHFSLSSTGEGNGNPLQRSCLENPKDGGAWWAAVCGVTQSRTRLKWLSSSIMVMLAS